MSISRRISGHRQNVILVVLVALSLVSLASGTRGHRVSDGVRTVVGVVSLPFLFAFNRVESAADYTTGIVFQYNDAREQSQTMAAEIARMRQRVSATSELEVENARLRSQIDFRRQHPQFSLLPAEVIQHARGVLTIDRGRLHGMRESMCVINPDGVIGIITQVGPLTSSVATLQSPECKIDAMIKWNRVRGRVFGSGSQLSALCTMHYIDLTDEIREGDRVVTSPDSVFPPGFPVGRVSGSPNRGHLSQSVAVQPAADPFRVDEVFVLLSATSDWRDLVLQEDAPPEPSAKLDLPITETVQERLAP